jgi:hypothetical protein
LWTATLSIALAFGFGCNSRRFVSAETGVGNAGGDSNAAETSADALGSDYKLASNDGVSDDSRRTAASSGAVDVLTGEHVGTSSDGASDVTATWGNVTGDTNAAAAGDSVGTASSGNDGASSDAVSTRWTGATSTTGDEATPMGSDTNAGDDGALVPASAAERDALIAGLAACAPGEVVRSPNSLTIDFDALTDAEFTSGVLSVGVDDPIDAVLAYYDDRSGAYALDLTAGSELTPRALRAVNPAASEWGGGIAIMLPCFDASAFEGIEFSLRGETPVGTIAFSVDTRSDASASTEIVIPAAWTVFRVPFSDLVLADTAGSGGGLGGAPGGFGGGPGGPFSGEAFDGSAVRSLVWSSQLRYTEQPPRSGNWQAETGAFEIVVDQVRFY